MPANLTPQYHDAEERYRKARDDRERLSALKEMLSTIPKHKGTEKLQADLKKKIAQLRSAGGGKGGSRRAPSHSVERSGAAQVVLAGPPNSGKSRFVADLTAADPEVAEYPFSTRTPTPGILLYEKIPLQVVDLPPLTGDHVEPWLTDLVRNADLLLVMLDLGSDELLEHWEQLVRVLDGFSVSIDEPPPIEEREIGVHYHRCVIGGGRADLPEAAARREILRDLIGDRPVHPFSLETGEGVDALLAEVVRSLDLIRVFTKVPGEEADLEEPYVVQRGATVEDAARGVHKELAENLKLARAWGPRFHDGQPVSKDLVLEDGDVLEFHQ